MINQNINNGGIYRAYILAADSDIRVYIPGLHNNSKECPVNSDGSINMEIFQKTKDTYPKPLWCVPNLEAKQHDEIHPCWITFENGDITRPIIMGFLGKGIKYSAGSNSGGSGDFSGNNEQFVIDPDIPVDQYIYPLETKHTLDPFSGGRAFGASRDGGNRAHAGIDLIVPHGTKVLAATDGVVNYISYGFYAGTDAIITKNSDGTWFTYGEISPKVSVNSKVIKGQVIGTVIANNSSGASMLHFEAYKGDYESNVLNNNGIYKYVSNKNYNRRADLIDPSFVASLPMYNNG